MTEIKHYLIINGCQHIPHFSFTDLEQPLLLLPENLLEENFVPHSSIPARSDVDQILLCHSGICILYSELNGLINQELNNSHRTCGTSQLNTHTMVWLCMSMETYEYGDTNLKYTTTTSPLLEKSVQFFCSYQVFSLLPSFFAPTKLDSYDVAALKFVHSLFSFSVGVVSSSCASVLCGSVFEWKRWRQFLHRGSNGVET